MNTVSRSHTAFAVLTGLAALGLAAPAAQAESIDSFSSGPFAYTVGKGGADGGDQTANVPGSDRTVTVFNPYSATPFAATLPIGGGGVTVGPGYALFGLSYGTRYNGNASTVGTAATSAHLDLSHADRLRFTFSAVSGTVRIFAALEQIGGGSLSNGNMGDPAFTISAPGAYDLPFSGLNAHGSVDLSNVDILSLSLQTYGGSTFTLNDLSAAPEPTAWAGLGLGALGLGWLMLRARRHRA